METMTLSEWYDRLEAHDWFYAMSDDHSVYRRGREDRQKIIQISNELGGEYTDLFNQFVVYYVGHGDTKPVKDPAWA